LSHGVVAAFVPRPLIIAIVDCCNAAAFSVTIRRYSAGVQLPRAIIELRRAIVSHEAAINPIIISGNGGRRRRASLFILVVRTQQMVPGVLESFCGLLPCREGTKR